MDFKNFDDANLIINNSLLNQVNGDKNGGNCKVSLTWTWTGWSV